MASSNPYKIDEDKNEARGPFDTLSLSDVNERLPDGTELTQLHECDCDNRTPASTVKRGDKWDLRYCENCDGLYGWHDKRADYL